MALGDREDRHGDGSTRMVSLENREPGPDPLIHSSSRLKITIEYRGAKPLRNPKFIISVYDYSDAGIFVLDSDATGGLPETLPAEGTVICITDPINLTPGRCFVNLRLLKGGALADYIQQAGVFDVEPDSSHKTRETVRRATGSLLAQEPVDRRSGMTTTHIPPDEIHFHPTSFCDRNGRLFSWKGGLYRGLTAGRRPLPADVSRRNNGKARREETAHRD